MTDPAHPYRREIPPRRRDQMLNRDVSRPHLRSVTNSGDVERDALLSQHAPRMAWDEFFPRFDWKQSEHVAVIGPNGQGKTTLLTAILPRRTYVAVLVTKPRDATIDKMIASGGYDRYEEWLDVDPDRSPRRVIWPNAKKLGAQDNQAKVFRHALDQMFIDGGWCTAVDEGYYLARRLKLSDAMMDYLTQGRSNNLSFVVGTQRPAWVPVEVYGESTHLFIWRTVEREALRRLSDLGAANADVAKLVIQNLEPHQCLYVNTRTGDMFRTRAPYRPTLPDQPPNR
jgi:energy-coupling factor transporter ATP-binding protein EcfA2